MAGEGLNAFRNGPLADPDAKKAAKKAEKAAFNKAAKGAAKVASAKAKDASTKAEAAGTSAAHTEARQAHVDAMNAHARVRSGRASEYASSDHRYAAMAHGDKAAKLKESENAAANEAHRVASATPAWQAAVHVKAAEASRVMAHNAKHANIYQPGTPHAVSIGHEGQHASDALHSLAKAHALDPAAGHEKTAQAIAEKHGPALDHAKAKGLLERRGGDGRDEWKRDEAGRFA